MIVDASIWVARFLEIDTHHDIARTCITGLMESESRIIIPMLAWAEIAGAIARRTGVAGNGHDAVDTIRAWRWVENVPLDSLLAQEAVRVADALKLRGADAVYVALAVMQQMPLITLDAEMLERARDAAEVWTPEQWLQQSKIKDTR